MTEREWRDRGADLKLMSLLLIKRIWIVILGTALGAAVCGGIYFLCHVVYAPAREYEAVSKLYLTFAAEDDGDAYQYYNGYTWNDLMGTEPILDYAMGQLTDVSELTREDVKKAVTADILSDIRVLTVTARTHDRALTERIIRAEEAALLHFAETMVEFDQIEVIDHGVSSLVVVESQTKRAVLLGAALGLFLTLFGMWIYMILDDAVYVPAQVEERFGCPVLGVELRRDKEWRRQELEANVSYRAGKNPVWMDVSLTDTDVLTDYDALRNSSGVILRIPYGKKTGMLTESLIRDLEIQECKLAGAVITDCDDRLYHAYYAGRRKG